MTYILLGADDFSKKEFIDGLKAKEKLPVFDFFNEGDAERAAQAVVQAAAGASLFESKKIILVHDMLGTESGIAMAQGLKDSQNVVVFMEEKLDKRKTETKKLLADKAFTVMDFEIPAGPQLRAWITQRAKQRGVSFGPKALDLFIARIGGDSQPDFGSEARYDLWQIDQELSKMKMHSGDAPVTAETVGDLVAESADENVFKITNAIADKNERATVQLLAEYLDSAPGSDEKSKIIGLSAIVAEQFRGILMIKSLLAQRAGEGEIAKRAGFTPGKVFVYKKLAGRFTIEKLHELLRKLELLDEEVKTSNGPAGLQFLMILRSAVAQ